MRERPRKTERITGKKSERKNEEEEYLLCLQGVFKLHSSTLTFESCGVQKSPLKKNESVTTWKKRLYLAGNKKEKK